MDKKLHPPLPQERRPQNYSREIILTTIAAKVYKTLLLNRIRPEVEKILTKNHNGLWRNRSTTSQILTCRIIERVRAKHSISYAEENWS